MNLLKFWASLHGYSGFWVKFFSFKSYIRQSIYCGSRMNKLADVVFVT